MQDLLGAGVHFGHKVRRGHPRMAQYIFGAKEGVHIIDLAKSEEKLKEATEAIQRLAKENKSLLIVGTKKQAKDIVKELAENAGAFYLTERWVGGILTNFDEIKRNIKKLSALKTEKEKGQLDRYTKKEQLLISRKLDKFDRIWAGAVSMEKIPDMMFVIDAPSDYTAIKEAKMMGIIIFGLCDTNADPHWFDFPIPANDDGIKSIKIIAETVINAYAEGKKELGIRNDELRIKAEKEMEIIENAALDDAVAEEAAIIEEEVEKKIVAESERKV